jgi:hypothetical protein
LKNKSEGALIFTKRFLNTIVKALEEAKLKNIKEEIYIKCIT